MSTDLIVVKQLPVIEEQLRTVKMTIQDRVNDVLSMECTEATYREVKKARAELNAEFRELEARRKAVKAQVEAPYKAFEQVYKDCAADIYAQADRELAEKIRAVENGLREQKLESVIAYFNEYRDSLGLTDDIADFYNSGVKITLSASGKALKAQAKEYLDRVRDDFRLMHRYPEFEEILVEYRRCRNAAQAVDAVYGRHAQIESARQRRLENEKAAQLAKEHAAKVEQAIADEEVLTMPEAAAAPAEELPEPMGEPVTTEDTSEEVPAEPESASANRFSVSFRVIGTMEQLKAMKKFLNDGGYEYEQLN